MTDSVGDRGRVVIVGGGIAGLATAVRLAQSRIPVTVLEKGRLGAAASTRNQGWLHSGAAYAPDYPGIAALCYESLRETLAYCPECVESTHAGAIFLLDSRGTHARRWRRAWSDVGLPYLPLPPTQLAEQVPALSVPAGHDAFVLPDRSFRTDVLLRRLADDAQKAGAELLTGIEVARLVADAGTVRGVVTAAGEEIPARLTVLAADAGNLSLVEQIAPRGGFRDCTHAALMTHLIAVDPGPSDWAICVPGLDGFNHLPHPPASIFGSGRWLPVPEAGGQAPIAAEFDRVRELVTRLFPGAKDRVAGATAWAGTTLQVVPRDREVPTAIAWPAVIDHSQEPEAIEGLVSVFPGRATLWSRLAADAHRVVSGKVHPAQVDVEAPPWVAR